MCEGVREGVCEGVCAGVRWLCEMSCFALSNSMRFVSFMSADNIIQKCAL